MATIEVKYHVEGKAFNTREEAEQHLANVALTHDLINYLDKVTDGDFEELLTPERAVDFIRENKQRVLDYIKKL